MFGRRVRAGSIPAGVGNDVIAVDGWRFGVLGVTGRRSLAVAALLCAGLGAGTAVAVHASASGGGATPSPVTVPKPGDATVTPPVRPRSASGQLIPEATATNAHCGQTITASLTLNGDLFCSATGPALMVSGNGVVLNLGAHEIAGPGGSQSSSGVTLAGNSDTVENGLVTRFVDGIIVNGVGDTVSAVRASYNNFGVYDDAQGTKITNSVTDNDSSIGIYSIGAAATYSGDHEVSNGGYGVLVQANRLTIVSNIANGNKQYGIWDRGVATIVTNNIADFNGWDGIYISDVAAIDGGGNAAKGNDLASGQIAEQCSGIVCQ